MFQQNSCWNGIGTDRVEDESHKDEGARMILVIDTNLLISNPADGRFWTQVRDAVQDDVLTVVVPRIVPLELQERVPESRRATKPARPERDGFRRAPAEVRNAVEEAYRTALDKIDQWAASYDAEQLVEGAGFTIRESPDVAHDVVASRAARRAPRLTVRRERQRVPGHPCLANGARHRPGKTERDGRSAL